MRPDRIDIDELLALRRHAGALDLSSRRRVLTDLGGTHLSGFRGRGMEFEEFRAYQPGDDTRTIDWRVTARTGHPHVRVFREERERPVLLAVDDSPSMRFATRNAFKSVVAARAAALVSWAAVRNGDRIGGLVFGRDGHAEVRPGGGRRGAMKLFRALATPEQATADDSGYAVDGALQRLRRLARPGSLVFLISDCATGSDELPRHLRMLARHVELVMIWVTDPLESQLPPPGRYGVAGDDGSLLGVLDSNQSKSRQAYAEAFEARRANLMHAARSAGAHWVELSTEDDLVDCLARGLGGSRGASIGQVA